MLKRCITIVLILGLVFGFAGSRSSLSDADSNPAATQGQSVGHGRFIAQALPWQDGAKACDSTDSPRGSSADENPMCKTFITVI